ncbi:hypothetical protein H5410_061007 [Solanum commersonii]|uniref:Reverse transcriptase zinc-binding domain-containing protein n=1 Tax=Solanum commersonii TaxID=4109 RepID=A0A9J5W6Y9_SOLCO|nr:hypothetical protein H5410_061007 [Solanum commersonii]
MKWKYNDGKGSAWKNLINDKYVKTYRWSPPIIQNSSRVGIWSNISGGVSLKNRFPTLYNCSSNKDGKFLEYYSSSGWQLNFRREFNDRENGRCGATTSTSGLSLEKLNQDKLQRRGLILSKMCYLCEEELKSVNQLFVHCGIAKQCRKLFLNLCGVVRSLLDGW